MISIGQATTEALKKHQIIAQYQPATANSEELLKLPSLQLINNQNILLVKGEGGRKLIEHTMLVQAARVFPLEVYKRTKPVIRKNLSNLYGAKMRSIFILITSEQSANNLFTLFGKDALLWLQNKPWLVISERLAKIASLFGIKQIHIALLVE